MTEEELRPAALPVAETLPITRRWFKQLCEAKLLLREALDSVEADEQARRESWPDEVKRGELTLDLAARIRVFLEQSSHD
ncbi:MAG: hypothetical protein HC875_39450 [Anaerolineales bacterium]|nr:hypothetical protein [Anaerolineales bacterium]